MQTPLACLHLRKHALGAMMSGLDAVKPRALLPKFIQRTPTNIVIASTPNFIQPIAEVEQIIVVGGGKASGEMAVALVDILGDDLPIRGSINVPIGQNLPDNLHKGKTAINFVFAGHPLPDANGLSGTATMIQLLKQANPSTLVFQLISGGGSALMPAPSGTLTLQQEQHVTNLLLASGADIAEINTVRRHMSNVKGGKLGQLAIDTGAHCVGLILSDCVGDPLEVIAGGPTVPDPSTFGMALRVIEKYGIDVSAPYLKAHLEEGIKGIIPDTLKESGPNRHLLHNILIGSAKTAANIVLQSLTAEGYTAIQWSNELQGDANDFGSGLMHTIQHILQHNALDQSKIALIATGEFTVTLRGKGVGGRNQQMLLAFLVDLKARLQAGQEEQWISSYDYAIVSGAFDGIEGNSPAMGAIVDNTSLDRINHLPIKQHLDNNDSYTVFHHIHDDIDIGYTGTNVNDMLLILLQRK